MLAHETTSHTETNRVLKHTQTHLLFPLHLTVSGVLIPVPGDPVEFSSSNVTGPTHPFINYQVFQILIR